MRDQVRTLGALDGARKEARVLGVVQRDAAVAVVTEVEKVPIRGDDGRSGPAGVRSRSVNALRGDRRSTHLEKLSEKLYSTLPRYVSSKTSSLGTV